MNLMRQISATMLLLCLVTFAYAQGDDCANAMAIVPGMYTADGPSAGGGSTDQTNAANADWYSFTPGVSGLLSVDACMGGADTRLWVWSGACGALVAEASNDDFCDLGNGNAYASAVSDVIALAGTTYYLEWDDRWDVAGFNFNMVMDTITDANDGAILGDEIIYTTIPQSQVPAGGISFDVLVGNLGFATSTNLTVTVAVQDATGATVYSGNSTPGNFTALQTGVVSAGMWAPPVGTYEVCYTVAIDETDSEAGNDNFCRPLTVSATSYANDDNIQTGGLGTNGVGIVDQGQGYFMYNSDMMTSISAMISGGAAGDTLLWQVFEVNAGVVGATVYDSGPTVLAAAAPGWLHHVPATPIAVTGGQEYLINIRHFNSTPANIQLGFTDAIYTPGNAWVQVNQGGWTHPEAFGFALAYMLRPNFGTANYACTATVDMSNETVDAAGVNIATYDAADMQLGLSPCVDNMDGTWTCQFTGTSLATMSYVFVNGSGNAATDLEIVPSGCSMMNSNGFAVRPVQIGFQDETKALTCFAGCGLCPTAACAGPNEVLCEDMEIYDATMPLGPQSNAWTTWSGTEGGAEDGTVSTAQASSGTNSMSIVGGAGGGPQDILLLLGDLTSGRYRTTFQLYVPAGSGAYYNIQHFEVPATEWAHQIIFNADGTAQLDAEAVATTFNYTQDAWITVDQIIDMDNDWTTLMVDGQQLYAWPFSAQANVATGTNQLGAYNFYPLDDTNVFYVDDVYLEAMPACSIDPETIICDDFEFYPSGSFIGPQSQIWSTWSGTEGTAEDALSSSDYALSGSNSMLIAEGQAQDVLLLGGNRTTGYFELKWHMYIPTGANGYYNLQGSETAGQFFEMENFLNPGGAGEVNGGATYTYPHDTWFEVKHLIDLDNDVMEVSVNGAVVEAAWPYANMLGGVDFFSIDGTNRYYVDDLTLKQLPTPTALRAVTFNVNMNEYASVGAVSPDGVHIAGTFQGWDPAASEMTDPDGDNIYSFTASITEGDVVEFKFVNGNAWGADEAGITADCGVDGGAGSFNRVWTVGSQDESTPSWCFNECVTSCTPLSIDQATFDTSLKMYPNPATGNTAIYYSFPEAISLDVRMTNSVGQEVYARTITNALAGNVELNVSDIAPGVYFVSMSDGENITTKKLFVEK